MIEVSSGNWTDFFVAEVGASAALTGLVVVAISINLARILAYKDLPGRAAEALFLLGGVLVLASVALVPRQPIPWLGAETLAIGLAMFGAPAVIQLRSRQSRTVSASRKALRAALTAIPSLAIVVAGLLLLLDRNAGLYSIAAGMILALVTGVLTTWVLLIEILR